MDDGIEKYQVGGRNPLDSLLDPHAGSLPNKIPRHVDDILHITGHESVHAAAANMVFAQMDYVAAKVIEGVPAVREQFVTGSTVQLAEFEMDEFVQLTFSRFSQGDEVTYTVVRSDIGSNGGFMFCQRSDGSYVIRDDDLECFDPGTPEFQQALKQIYRIVKLFAHELNVFVMPNLHEAVTRTERFRENMTGMYKDENSMLGHLKKQAKFALNTLVDIAKLPVTSKRFPELEGNRKRKLAPARIALLALLTPVPGFSSHFYEPASAELAGRVYEDMFVHTPTTEEVAQSEFQESTFDIAGIEPVTLDGELRPIEVLPSLPENVTQYAAVQQITTYRENDPITLDSPTRLDFAGELMQHECAEVIVDAELRAQELAVFTTNEGDTRGIDVAASADGRIKFCNTTDNLLPVDGRSMYVDPRS